jgi:GAF domain-containing protein
MVAFPGLGQSVPVPALLDAGQGLESAPPHWFVHLQVLLAGTLDNPARRFSLADGCVKQLARLLRLDRQDFEVGLREHVPGLVRDDECSPLAFPVVVEKGVSFRLSLLVGLASSACNLANPPSFAFSGSLPDVLDDSLRLEGIGGIEEKVELCLGRLPEYDIRYLVELLYRYPATTVSHGPKENRTVSGKVKLLVIPQGSLPEDLRHKLGAVPLDMRLADFHSQNPDELERQVRELAGDGMLLVQVSTGWHALGLLGFQHHHQPVKEALDRYAEEDIYVFHVNPDNCDTTGEGEKRYRERRAQEALRLLDASLKDLWRCDIHGRLCRILRQCVEQLGYCDGNVTRVWDRPELLRVVAAWQQTGGQGLEGLPVFVPADEGINALAFETGETQVAESREAFAKFYERKPPTDTLGREYSTEVHQRYRELINQIPACVLVPLRHEGKVIGTVCLHGAKEGPVDSVDLYVVERLAERAAHELVEDLKIEEEAHRRRDDPRRVQSLVKEVEGLLLGAAIERLGHDLAVRALERSSGAYRACVRLLSDNQTLAVIGHAGAEGVWPPGFLQRTFARAARSACNRALNENASYLIADTQKKDIHYEEVEPPAAAHLAVVVRNGEQPIGVLSVDFDREHRGVCTTSLMQTLEELARLYGGPIQELRSERLTRRLHACLSTEDCLSGDGGEPPQALNEWLDVLGTILGVPRGALYLRNPLTGEYHLRSTLAEGDGAEQDGEYEPGEGRTGWVARYNKPLRIADCEDREELNRIDPPLRPSTKTPCCNLEQEKLAYLGVPVSGG